MSTDVGFGEIEWDGEAVRYGWPLPADVVARINAATEAVDGRIPVVAVHPDDVCGWLCLQPTPGQLETVRVECSEDGDRDPDACWVRFGTAPEDVFDRMGEFDGW